MGHVHRTAAEPAVFLAVAEINNRSSTCALAGFCRYSTVTVAKISAADAAAWRTVASCGFSHSGGEFCALRQCLEAKTRAYLG